MVIIIKVEGIEFMQHKFNQLGKNFKKNIVGVLQESAILMKEEIEESIQGNRAEHRSVDTGEFLSSIMKENTSMGAIISSDAPQSVFMEYGTSKISERRHFRNSADRLTPIIVEKVVQVISDTI